MLSDLAHVLIVEDNEDDYEATRRSFVKNHFVNPLSWSRSAEEALRTLRSNDGSQSGGQAESRPDLILLDLNMPGMDGRRFLEIIKADEKLKSIPVVVLTTSSDAMDIERCYQLGASTYIQKPVSFDGLTKAVSTMKDYWFGIALLPSPPK
jgi:two-component system, response regulator